MVNNASLLEARFLEQAWNHRIRVRTCEDCGDPVSRRRHRCRNCTALVCDWCWGHIHRPFDAQHKRDSDGSAP